MPACQPIVPIIKITQPIIFYLMAAKITFIKGCKIQCVQSFLK
jgi:hypothetical protein